MFTQTIQLLPGLAKRLPVYGYASWVALFFLSLNLSATTVPTEISKGQLPIPGTTQTNEYLTLSQNGVILENDGVTLQWNSDGNLALYFYNKEIFWQSSTGGKGSLLIFQESDGKLIIKDGGGNVIWSTTGTGGQLLQLQADRNLVLLSASNRPVWESNSTITYLNSTGLGTVYSNNKKSSDYAIPAEMNGKYLFLRAEGADGGARHVEESWGSIRFKVGGGEGATVRAVFAIGDASNQIPVGAVLRFVVGEPGKNRTSQNTSGSPGGGGTGVLFKKPNDLNWTLLMAAGGGGGAYSDCCSVKRTGHPGESGENGGQGGQSGGKGGVNGSYGNYSLGTMQYIGYGGGGAYEGQHDDGEGAVGTYSDPHYESGGPGWLGARTKDSNGSYSWDRSQLPQGGEGGEGGASPTYGDTQGPWGFGGGGSGNVSGGGGGGYSGGGGGYAYYPGGGGGSYINTDYAKSSITTQNGTTTSPGNGFATYQFTNTPNLYNTIQFAKNTSKCIDLYHGKTAKGSNIQLYSCNGQPSQQWVLDGDAIRYAADPNKCVDLSNSNTDNGTNIQLWDCNNTDAQRWVFDGVNQSIRSRINFTKCIDLLNGQAVDGNNLQVWDCKDNDAQRWSIEQATLQTPSDTKNRIHYVKDTDKCVDVSGTGTANGNSIMIYSCGRGVSQYWYFDGNTIRLNYDRNKCLDVDHSKTDNGTNIQLWDCDDTDAQHWTYDGMTRSFRSWVNGGKCLDVDHSSTADGTNIQLYDCNGTDAQQFKIGN